MPDVWLSWLVLSFAPSPPFHHFLWFWFCLIAWFIFFRPITWTFDTLFWFLFLPLFPR
ncbi:hypothetical protein C8J56DRAFT_988094 [Mycena floridula]|nr:hypothetical protein C8J56DRAFT_988094 [Mycena floridula]